jgi:hypothetical protein
MGMRGHVLATLADNSVALTPFLSFQTEADRVLALRLSLDPMRPAASPSKARAFEPYHPWLVRTNVPVPLWGSWMACGVHPQRMAHSWQVLFFLDPGREQRRQQRPIDGAGCALVAGPHSA